ncbi:hypothetical protein [Streptomyces sp. H27-C3]|uniref:hypothetical protein n=1 Tax=Streptomyces sp. H27-C3 TaxID=3046305 RepID=UPI0024BAB82E|nr:hypothetical protein [Streptomyces sp. H27-C3]MDJ0466936.1 hypothetical protein [Streptomyces sp. H27-C3]
MHVAPMRSMAVQDHIALAEIELCGELMIAASAADGERLSPDRIDEVLEVPGAMGAGATAAGVTAAGVGGAGVIGTGVPGGSGGVPRSATWPPRG